MIHKDEIQLGSNLYDHVYSDISVYIKKDKVGGNEELYVDTYDPIKYRDIWTYTETDLSINI